MQDIHSAELKSGQTELYIFKQFYIKRTGARSELAHGHGTLK